MNNTIEALKQKLAQLKQLHASGVLPDEKFEEGKSALERQILDLVLSGAPVAAAPTASGATKSASADSAAPAGASVAPLGAVAGRFAAGRGGARR